MIKACWGVWVTFLGELRDARAVDLIERKSCGRVRYGEEVGRDLCVSGRGN